MSLRKWALFMAWISPSSAKIRQFGSLIRRASSARVSGPNRGDLGVAEHDQARLDVLGQRPARARHDRPAGGPGRSRGPTTGPS